jgi:hypothetical protein
MSERPVGMIPAIALPYGSNDPVNPAHYAGRACADIGERLTGNGYQILKYVWRLGKKEPPFIELGKAVWYAESEIELLKAAAVVAVGMRTAPLAFDLEDPAAFLKLRIQDQPHLTQTIARMLWYGYNADEMQAIRGLLDQERKKHASS